VASEEALAAAVAALLQAHGIAVAPGRAERLAAALMPLLDKSGRDQVEDAPDFAAVMEAQRWKS
jgi:hypothetical protein